MRGFGQANLNLTYASFVMQTEKLPKVQKGSVASHQRSLLFYFKGVTSLAINDNLLLEAAKAFKRLIGTEYFIVLGKKMKTKTLIIRFAKDNFYHLAGLHKLNKAYSFQNLAAEKIFSQILLGEITYDSIQTDENIGRIHERLNAINRLENILDDDKSVFFGYKRNKTSIGSNLHADYLVKGDNGQDIVTFTFFIRDREIFYANSIFPMGNYDYSCRQTRYTVLLKKKIVVKTGNETVLSHHPQYVSILTCDDK